MATDVESYLQPISEEQPKGVDVRENASYSSPYQTLKLQREQAKNLEKAAANNITSGVDASDEIRKSETHWQEVFDIACNIIKDEAKDIEVACWLTEAAVRLKGLEGLKFSFQLLAGLVENFGVDLYPTPEDDEGLESTFYSLDGLNSSPTVIIDSIRKIPLTDSATGQSYNFEDYSIATNSSDDLETANKYGFNRDSIQQAMMSTDQVIFDSIREDLRICAETYRSFGLKLDELCRDAGSHYSPSTRDIVDAIEACESAIRHLAEDRIAMSDAVEDASAEDGAPAAGQAVQAKAATASGPIASRDDALKQLTEIAKFFRKIEPHSPVSYAVEKAVRWGKMPLGELMKELLSDGGQLSHFSELTGVEVPEDDSY